MGEKEMTWEKFVVIWSKYLNTSIPQESIREWQKFAKTADDAVLTEAVNVVADKYQAAADKGNNKAPTLYQLANAYGEIFREKRGTKSFTGCEFCEKEASATVYVIDSGDYHNPDVFPPDPATWSGRRSICVVPCPCCRANDYGDQRIRERVQRYSRPFSRRNELLKMREVSA
jgi:hypothetical protein